VGRGPDHPGSDCTHTSAAAAAAEDTDKPK